MVGIFTLKVRIEFSGAHALRGYVGDCARIHGHNWKVEAAIKTRKLNNIGIGVDFKDVKAAMREIANGLEHQYINDIPPFDEINPTAENIAGWFFQHLKAVINNEDVKLERITLWETDHASVCYSEE